MAKREEKLKRKERQLDEEQAAKEAMEKELESLKKEISSLQTLNKRQDQALAKKDKQYNETLDQLANFKKIHAQIMCLSRTVQSENGDD